MGTNYYIKENICPLCKRADKEIHLGKSSSGWRFMFNYNKGRYYKDIKEMQKWLADKRIEDEYGEEVSHLDFWDMVQDKQKEKSDGGVGKYRDLIIIDSYDFYDREFS